MPYSWITDGTRYVLHPPSYDSIAAALDATARTYHRRLLVACRGGRPGVRRKGRDHGRPRAGLPDVGRAARRRARVLVGDVRLRDRRRARPSAHERAVQLRRSRPVRGASVGSTSSTRFGRFAPDADIEVERLAVTPEQIVELDCRPGRRKRADTRPDGMATPSRWTPSRRPRLRTILDAAIAAYVDEHELEVLLTVEREERELLTALAGQHRPGGGAAVKKHVRRSSPSRRRARPRSAPRWPRSSSSSRCRWPSGRRHVGDARLPGHRT